MSSQVNDLTSVSYVSCHDKQISTINLLLFNLIHPLFYVSMSLFHHVAIALAKVFTMVFLDNNFDNKIK